MRNLPGKNHLLRGFLVTPFGRFPRKDNYDTLSFRTDRRESEKSQKRLSFDNKLAGDDLIQIYSPGKPNAAAQTSNQYKNRHRLTDFWFHLMSFRHFL